MLNVRRQPIRHGKLRLPVRDYYRVRQTDLKALGEGDNTLEAMDAFTNNYCFCPQS